MKSEPYSTIKAKKIDAPSRQKAIDCGAGIGRITKHFLTKLFASVDMVEQCSKLTAQAEILLKGNQKVGRIFNKGLQDFEPEKELYDLIWIQWVLIYLTDEDLVSFLKRCKKALKPRGIIVVKENVTSSPDPEPDHEDSSVTRPEETLEDLFSRASLRIIKKQQQHRFPQELFKVQMYALRPDQ
ncbi:hypothetical protein QYM36_009158 [Artemia franciscana]|uniref:Alpha N-terminal protein methyltransferase 1 n=1 Tax=Artemia franciscana TaxID=6661 RepID=A0AA88HVQ6_ARTSF|nr:hypothetical protein QYM36_009158 [Artemia franciscana]